MTMTMDEVYNMAIVNRLQKHLERLKQSWFECQQHVRHRTVLSTIELIESWTEVSVVSWFLFVTSVT